MSIVTQYELALLFMITAIPLLWIGFLVGGWIGIEVVLGLMILIHLKFKDWTSAVLLYLHDAKEFEESHDPELFCIVHQLAQRANLPLPRLYVMPEETPNAFSVGRNPHGAAIILTDGFRHVLDRDEQAAVIAHELAHIKSGDTLLMSIVATLASFLYLAEKATLHRWMSKDHLNEAEVVSSAYPGLLEAVVWGLTLPIAGILTRVMLNSFKEFEADEVGAWLTGEPLVFASALHKMEAALVRTRMRAVTPATAHLFTMNPYVACGRRCLVKSHPATSERIGYLQELARRRHDPGFAA